MPNFTCEFCNRSNFKSAGGLKQHHMNSSCYPHYLNQWQIQNPSATGRLSAHEAEIHDEDTGIQGINEIDQEFEAILESNDLPDTPPTPRRSPGRLRGQQPLFDHDMDAVAMRIGDMLGNEMSHEQDSSDDDDLDLRPRDSDSEIDAGFGNHPPDSEESSMGSEERSPESEASTDSDLKEPIRWIREQFHEYVVSKQNNTLPLNKDEVRAIQLMQVLRKKKHL